MVTMYVGNAIDDYQLGSYHVDDDEYTTNHHGQLWDMNQTKLNILVLFSKIFIDKNLLETQYLSVIF